MRKEPQATFFFNDVTPESSLRVIDQTIVDWLSSLRFRNQTPHVQNAYLSRQFAATHEIEETAVPDVKQIEPYPQVSVLMTAIEPDLERRNARGFLTNFGPRARIWDLNLGTSVEPETGDPRISPYDNRAYVSADQDEIYLLPWPLAFNMMYQIDFITKTGQDMALLRSAFLARFESVNETYLQADFPGIGKQLLRVSLDAVTDTSDLEPSNEMERTLRSTIDIVVHGWIFRVPVRKKTIKNIHVVVIDASGDDPVTDCPLDDGSEFLSWYNDPDNYVFNADGSALLSVAESPTFAPPDRVLFWVSKAEDGTLTTGP